VADLTTRQGLWWALKARRCYGTTGQRIRSEIMADGWPMGVKFTTGEPSGIQVQVWGTEPIERVDIFRGLEQVYTYSEQVARDADRVRVAWSGQRIRARNRLVRWVIARSWEDSVSYGLRLRFGVGGNRKGRRASRVLEVGNDRRRRWGDTSTGRTASDCA